MDENVFAVTYILKKMTKFFESYFVKSVNRSKKNKLNHVLTLMLN